MQSNTIGVSRLFNNVNDIQYGFIGKNNQHRASATEIQFVTQVHGNRLVDLESRTKENIEADGIITRRRGFTIGVKTADCVPLLLYEPNARIVGVVHAGWKGIHSRIAQKAVEQIIKSGGTPRNILVSFGPSIDGSCYDIPLQRVRIIQDELGHDPKLISESGSRYYFDLRYAIYKQLITSGIRKENIEINKWCTYCDTNIWYSRRREKGIEIGSNISYIRLN